MLPVNSNQPIDPQQAVTKQPTLIHSNTDDLVVQTLEAPEVPKQESLKLTGSASSVTSRNVQPPEPRSAKSQAIKGVPASVATISAKLRTEFADALHADWQATARASGRTERFKPVKEGGKTVECHTPEELRVYLDSKGIPADYRSRYRLVDSKVEENILAIPNRYLAANNRAENDASASATIDLIAQQIMRGGSLDAAFIEKASSVLHDKWVERNGCWAPEEQKLPFDQLSKAEADKDRDMVRQGVLLFTQMGAVGSR
jgi:hypothetical protein